jgi:hypothetical protein
MMRPAILMAVCGSLICGIAAADEDAVGKKLAAAKEEYEKVTVKARAGLLAVLKKQEEIAQKAGDLKTLEQVQAEAKSFENGGVLPKSVSTKVYESQMRTARTKLEEAYGAAVKQYTKDGKIALAKAVQQDLDEFKKGGGVEPSRSQLDKQLKVVSDDTYFRRQGPANRLEIKETDGLIYAKVAFDRKNVICTHPVDRQKPATIDFGGVTKGERGTLVIYACSSLLAPKTPGGRVIVKVGGRVTKDIEVKKDGQWAVIEVPFNGQGVVVEHHPLGWNHEAMFFDYEIKLK